MTKKKIKLSDKDKVIVRFRIIRKRILDAMAETKNAQFIIDGHDIIQNMGMILGIDNGYADYKEIKQ